MWFNLDNELNHQINLKNRIILTYLGAIGDFLLRKLSWDEFNELQIKYNLREEVKNPIDVLHVFLFKSLSKIGEKVKR